MTLLEAVRAALFMAQALGLRAVWVQTRSWRAKMRVLQDELQLSHAVALPSARRATAVYAGGLPLQVSGLPPRRLRHPVVLVWFERGGWLAAPHPD